MPLSNVPSSKSEFSAFTFLMCHGYKDAVGLVIQLNADFNHMVVPSQW